MDVRSLGYRVRVSRRARHVRLVVSDVGELTVVVPLGAPTSAAPRAIEANLAWLQRALARVGPEARDPVVRPDALELRALGERWTVRYLAGAARCGVSGRDGELVVTTPADDDEDVRRTLERWLRRRALGGLVARLEELATDAGVALTRVSVRAPRTRWASCSATGAIMLSSQLLFLPPRLVDHVIWHELCHRFELNHSTRFWRLLDAHSPDARRTDAELREARRLVPRFLRA